MPSDARFSPLGIERKGIFVQPRRCAVFATSALAVPEEFAEWRSRQPGEEEGMRCFRRRARSKGNHRCRLYNPGSTSTFPPRLYQLDSLSSSPTISINRLLPRKPASILPTYHLNPNDQQLHNNVVVLSIPKGRDQADPGRMLVSLGPPPRRPLDLPTDATSSLFLSCGTKCSPISGSEACSCPGQCSCAGCPNRKTEAVDSDPKEGCS